MIRMPSLPVRQNHHLRTCLANHAGDLQAVLPSVLDTAIGNVECPAPFHAQNVRRVRRFARPIFRGAACAHFPLGQIEDAGALSPLRRLQQRAAAGLLDVVTVCGDGKYVEGGARGKGRHVSRDCPAPARRFPARSDGESPFPST